VKRSEDFQQFNRAMDKILRADPAKVKAAVDTQVQASVAERKARGERKRGRKPDVLKKKPPEGWPK
jgi:hypothetical protein